MSVAASQRYTRTRPCPICGGHDQAPRGRRIRCVGFLSNDGEWARCSREEHAGSLTLDEATVPPAFVHRLTGECRCGKQHGPMQPSSNGHHRRSRGQSAAMSLGREVDAYDYRDADGNLLYQNVRYADPKNFRMRRPDGAGGWTWSMGDTGRVLYRLPELVDALTERPERWVILGEGEKDTDRLRSEGLIATCYAGGANARWEPAFAEALRGRRVAILWHYDKDGFKRRDRDAAALHGVAAEVRLVDLPGLEVAADHGQDVSDWLDAGHAVDELKNLIREAPAWAPTGKAVPALPEIVVSGDLPAMTTEALLALGAANEPPHIFTRGLDLARIVPDDEQRPAIQSLDVHALRGELARCADWHSIDKKGERHAAHPPMPVVQDIRTWPERGDGFPPLAGIIEAPALRPDGTIICRPGYDRATRLWYEPAPDLQVPEIPSRPSQEQVRESVELIEDAIGEFPFVDDAARANAYALLLTPVVRAAIPGPVPLALLDAPQQGTGKTLFASVVAHIATGRGATTRSAPETEEEWRKALTTMLRAGAGFVLFDNIRLIDWRGEFRPLESAALAAVLTAWPSYSDRVLGASEEGRWPVRQTWVASGNNIIVGGDLMRRCYRVRLDAESPRPWQGRRFRHPKLLSYVNGERGQLLGALLTIARAWFEAGRPTVNSPDIASFESWAEMLGGIVHHAGIAGFLGDLAEFYRDTDETASEWTAFLDRWLALWPTGGQPECSTWQTTRDVLAAMPADQGGLREVLPSELVQVMDAGGSVDRKLGRALKRRAGIRVDDRGLRLEKGDEPHTKVARWRVTTG